MRLIVLARTKHPTCKRVLARSRAIEKYYLKGAPLGPFEYERPYLDACLQETLADRGVVQPYEYGYYDTDHVSMAKTLHYPLDVLYKLYDKLLTDPEVNRLPIYMRQHLIYDAYYPRYLSSFYAKLLRFRLRPTVLSPAIYQQWLPSPSMLFRMLRALK